MVGARQVLGRGRRLLGENLLEKTLEVIDRPVMRKINMTVVEVWGPSFGRDLMARLGCRGGAVDLVDDVTGVEEERGTTTKGVW